MMKQAIVISLLVAIAFFTACKKSSSTDTPADTPLVFSSLTAADTLVKVNQLTTITAAANGDGLTYKWTASYGTFVGSGATVQWTVCHASRFTITCEVKDKYNHAEKKTIAIRSHN